jgi:hypothetical protein
MNTTGIATRNLEHYKHIHATKEYGVSAHRRERIILPYLRELQPKAILDYGAGRCETVTRVPGAKGFLFDPAIPKINEIPSEFLEYPYKDRAILCSHVLEHLDEPEIDEVLEHLQSLAPNVMIIVPTTKARQILPSGENAHATVRDLVWWTNKIRKYFRYVSRVQGHSKEPTFLTWIRKSNTYPRLHSNLPLPELRGKSVAVVGKAESILGSGEGDKIDSFDVVVRVNCVLPLDKAWAEDIGTRTDLLFFNQSLKPAVAAAEKAKVPYTKYDKDYRTTLKDDEGFVPFTGTVAVHWLLDQGVSHLYITGMDFYSSGSVTGRGGHLRTKRGTGTHDPSKDREMLRKLFTENVGRISGSDALVETLRDDFELKHYKGLKPAYGNYFPAKKRITRPRRKISGNPHRRNPTRDGVGVSARSHSIRRIEPNAKRTQQVGKRSQNASSAEVHDSQSVCPVCGSTLGTQEIVQARKLG